MSFESFRQAVKQEGRVSYMAALKRVRAGWSPEAAISVPRNEDPDNPLFAGRQLPGTRLTLLERVPTGRDVKWKCLCECGQIKVVYKKYLLNGKTRSCGCLRQKRA